jgi:hypothetical protein
VRYVSSLLGAAIAIRLIDQGWLPEQMPGQPVTLRSGTRTFDPFAVTVRLVDGSLGDGEWGAQCRELGLAGPLLPPALAAVTPPMPVEAIRAAAQEEAAARRRRRAW